MIARGISKNLFEKNRDHISELSNLEKIPLVPQTFIRGSAGCRISQESIFRDEVSNFHSVRLDTQIRNKTCPCERQGMKEGCSFPFEI